MLLDPPCTALGLRPRLLHGATRVELEKTATYQRGLIWTAVRLLRPGGVLSYSTCTVNPLENEAQVAYILKVRSRTLPETCTRTDANKLSDRCAAPPACGSRP